MAIMKPNSKYVTLQACVAITFVFVVIMTFKFSAVKVTDSKISSMTAIFDVKPVRLKEERQRNVPHKPYDYILENQRIRIDTEMDQFPYEGNQQLADLVLETGGQPKRAMVIKNSDEILNKNINHEIFFYIDCHYMAKWFHLFRRYSISPSCHLLSLRTIDQLPNPSNP